MPEILREDLEPGPRRGVWVLDKIYSKKNTELGQTY